MHPKDEYDEATGLKVSMAKAEIVAYKKVSQWIASLMSLIIDRFLLFFGMRKVLSR